LPLEGRVLVGLLFASVAVYYVTPVAIRVATRLDFYDKPIGYKGHARPTPYLGGSAVMVGFLLTLAAIAEDTGRSLPLAAGVAVLWAVGTIDDRQHVSPRLRAAIEIVLGAGLWGLGLGWNLGLGGGVDLALSCLWILAVVNAFNLFDNMDGAASTMALVVSGAIAALGALQGDAWLAATGAALAGACLGFLPHNLSSPARIFLGDGGSMPIGFAVAALVMMGVADAVREWQALVVGLLLVGLPALDTSLVVISRRRKGVSILTGGRDHLTHRTGRRLRDAKRVALVLGSVQALVAALALFAVEGGSGAVVGVVLLYLVAAGAAIALLEVEEDRLRAHLPVTGTPTSAGSPIGGSVPDWASLPALVALGVIGLGAALSPFWYGFYDATKWVPIGIGIVVAVAAAAISRPPRLSAPGAAALAAVAALALWSLLSSLWAESGDQAITEGNRMLVLAATLGLTLVLLRTERRAAWLVGTLGTGIGLVALWTVFTMLVGDGSSLFVAGRLHQPLGYINAEATVFIMGFWLLMALAERRTPLLAAVGLGGAALMASLVLLSQSRGAALAFAGSALAVLALVSGRRRRVMAMLVVATATAVAGAPLLEVYQSASTSGALVPDIVRRAARAALVISIGAGLVWAALTWLAGRALAEAPVATRRAISIAIGSVVVVTLALATSSSSRLGNTLERQYEAFVHLSEPTGSLSPAGAVGSRLVSGSGNRFDYWHVAFQAWEPRPLLGVGAGNYDATYFYKRATTEDVRQPHSIELQALAETGLIGAGLLLLAFGAIAIGAVRAGRSAHRSPLAHAVVVAGVGGSTAWMVHTSVDWMHLLPGVSAIAFCLMAALLRRDAMGDEPTRRIERRLRPTAFMAAGGVAAVLVIAGASLTRQGLADHFRQRALDALPTNPAGALVQANRSLRLNGDAVRTYYVKAAAQARFNRGAAAEQTLLLAAGKEPSDFVTWTLLGDLAVRRGQVRQARAFYARASRLNPRDVPLTKLADDPMAKRR
jgi:UDP-GlcNAc:undecaprenyl-phosphate GlcNAc-1-phosphate transferase